MTRFGEFVDVEPCLEAIDLNPQLLGLGGGTQMVLVLTYVLSMPGAGITGDVTVVIAVSTLTPMLERMLAHAAERAGAEADPSLMVSIAQQLPVQLEAHLASTTMSAGAVAAPPPATCWCSTTASPSRRRSRSPAPRCCAATSAGRSRLAISVSEHPFDSYEPAPAPSGPDVALGHHGLEQRSDDDADLSPKEHDARAADPSPSAVHSVR